LTAILAPQVIPCGTGRKGDEKTPHETSVTEAVTLPTSGTRTPATRRTMGTFLGEYLEEIMLWMKNPSQAHEITISAISGAFTYSCARLAHLYYNEIREVAG